MSSDTINRMPTTVRGTRSKDGPLTPRQQRFVEALVTSGDITASAKCVKTSEVTARKWLKRPTVARAYQEARRAILTDANDQLRAVSRTAVDVLTQCARDENARWCDRVAAAGKLLEHVIPRKGELAVQIDVSHSWSPVLDALSPDSQEYQAIVSLSERVMGLAPPAEDGTDTTQGTDRDTSAAPVPIPPGECTTTDTPAPTTPPHQSDTPQSAD